MRKLSGISLIFGVCVKSVVTSVDSTAENYKEIKFWSLLMFASTISVDAVFYLIYNKSFIASLAWQSSVYGTDLLYKSVSPITAFMFFTLAGWVNISRNVWKALIPTGLGLLTSLLILDAPNIFSTSTILAIVLLPAMSYWIFREIFLFILTKEEKNLINIKTFLWLTLMVLSVIVAVQAMLGVNSVLLTTPYDFYLRAIDEAYFGLAQWAAQIGKEYEQFQKITLFVYNLLGTLLFPLLAILIRDKKIRNLHAWRIFIIPYAIASICYIWLPGIGPAYAIKDYPFSTTTSEIHMWITPRNAMPSLHVSSAIWIFMLLAAQHRRWLRIGAAFFVLWTAWATLALGEHYFIDLVVAMPFAAALGTWLINPPNWKSKSLNIRTQWVSAATFVIWMLLLRLMPGWLQESLWFVRAFSVWSILIASWLIWRYLCCVRSLAEVREPASDFSLKSWEPPSLLPAELHGNRWLVGIFFFSGFAGLVYEVVYAKALAVTFGGTALAANTVLITYMGGMAIGAWIGGRLAERSPHPLWLYAIFEAAIGLYAAITPFLFSGIQTAYVAIATDSPPDAAWLTVLRMSLGAAVLGLPTVLMGATLPLVFQCLRSMGIPTARAIAPLYGANVLGAAVGSLTAGYVLLPAVGRNGGTLLAAVFSLMVALYVIDKIKRGLILSNKKNENENNKPIPSHPHISSQQGLSALAVLTIGGAVTLALEVVFMHLLAVVAGNSVYAFGLMLATFLAGLGIGSTVGERLMLQMSRTRLITWAQCGIAVSILLTAFVWDGLADYMGSFIYVAMLGLHLDFSARELIRALVCALAMIPPAFFIGMSYPAAMGVASDWLAAARFNGQVVRGVGLASALNTFGNIVGVLLTGFWLLPSFGSRNVLFGLALASALISFLIALSQKNHGLSFIKNKLLWIPSGVTAALLVFFPTEWNYTALSQGGNVYFHPQVWGEVIDHAESVEGGLTTVAKSPDNEYLTLLTNGKFQGNNAEGGEMVAQESIALIPLLHTTHRDEALVIGYGTGMTARVLQHQNFKNLDVVEISKDIVSMADKHFQNINNHISTHPSVRMFYTDGRNYLLTQSKKYDLISMEISSIWFAGAANLYNREFYQLASQRLHPQGILQQWVQMHHMRTIDFLYILGSIRSVFKNVFIYMSGGQGIIVAFNHDADPNSFSPTENLLNNTISELDIHQLHSTLLAEPNKVDSLLKCYDPHLNFLVSTDQNLYLEYATPKGNAMREDSTSILTQMLTSFQECPIKYEALAQRIN